MLRLTAHQAATLGITRRALNTSSAVRAAPQAQRRRRTTRRARDPQRELFAALCAALPEETVCWEAGGLVPGRRFRIDIYLPASRLAVEMDGFEYHRSKRAFGIDRERQNLLVAQDIGVLRYTTEQIFSRLESVVEQILHVHQQRRADRQPAVYSSYSEPGPSVQ